MTLRLLFVLAVLGAAPAAAQIRIWQDGGPPADDGGPSPNPDRFLDFTAFAQPGVIIRWDDANSPVTDDSFWLQRARMGFRAQLFPWLRMRMEVEMSGTVQLQDAYIEMPFHPAFTLRAGQMLLPFLRAYSFNEVNLGFLDRPVYVPIPPDREFIRFLNPRDVGVMATGMIGDPSPDATSPVFEYAAGAFIGAGPNFTRNSDGVLLYAIRTQLHVFGVPNGVQAESDLARNHTPRVAVAGALYSNCDVNSNWNRGFDLDAEFRYEGLYASASFVWFRSTAGDPFFADASQCRGTPDPTDPSGMGHLDFVSRGAHLQVQYVLPQVLFPIENMALELLTRIDFADPQSPHDPSNPLFGGDSSTRGYIQPTSYGAPAENTPTRWRLTFGVNFFPTMQQQVRVGLNYQHTVETEDVRIPAGIVHQIANDILWLQLTVGL